jgi:3-oxoacyl-(acyl-carrier-protein) synthase
LRGAAQTAADDGDGADLQPARAIRRALADAGLNAREVGLVAVHAVGPRARERAERAVSRGLGRFAAGVAASFDDADVAARCVAAIERGEVSAAVALTIDPDAGNRALAFGRRR